MRYLYHLAKDDVVIDELLGESHGVTQVHVVISWSVDQEQLIVPKMMDIPAQKFEMIARGHHVVFVLFVLKEQ